MKSTPDPVKSAANAVGDDQVNRGAKQAEQATTAPVVPAPPAPNDKLKPPIRRSALGRPIELTNFWLVTYAAAGDDKFAYAMLVPKEPDATKIPGAFYASPSVTFTPPPVGSQKYGTRSESDPSHTLIYDMDLSKVERWDPVQPGWVTMPAGSNHLPVPARWNKMIAAEDKDGGEAPAGKFTLAHLFDECFLYDADWNLAGDDTPYRQTTKWAEPPPLRHSAVDDLPGVGDDERKQARDNAQRDHASGVAANPLVASVYQARSTVLSMFLDQFVTLANDNGKRADLDTAHVTDLGLIFRGPIEEIEKLASLRVQKVDASGEGTVVVFNPKKTTWFVEQDPILQRTKKPSIDPAGIKIDWRLQMFQDPGASDKLDPNSMPNSSCTTTRSRPRSTTVPAGTRPSASSPPRHSVAPTRTARARSIIPIGNLSTICPICPMHCGARCCRLPAKRMRSPLPPPGPPASVIGRKSR